MDLRDYASNVIAKVQDKMKHGEVVSSFVAELTLEDFKKYFGEVPYSAVETFAVNFRLTQYTGPFSYPLARPCPTRVENKQSIAYGMQSGVKLETSEVSI